MRLRYLTIADEAEALKAHEELAEEGFEFLLGYEPGMEWERYLDATDKTRRGVDVPSNRVPASFLVAEAEGQIVGRISVRHSLNDFLQRVGGHIGYAVRPAHRRQGYAGRMLADALVKARELGIDRALLTCDNDNEASRTLIERCGGEADGTVRDHGKLKLRYWIST